MSARATHTRDDLRFALLSPFSNLRVNLIAEFRLYFTRVAGKEGKEALRSAVDDVDFVKGDGVDNLLALLDFAFWALYKFRLKCM